MVDIRNARLQITVTGLLFVENNSRLFKLCFFFHIKTDLCVSVSTENHSLEMQIKLDPNRTNQTRTLIFKRIEPN